MLSARAEKIISHLNTYEDGEYVEVYALPAGCGEKAVQELIQAGIVEEGTTELGRAIRLVCK